MAVADDPGLAPQGLSLDAIAAEGQSELARRIGQIGKSDLDTIKGVQAWYAALADVCQHHLGSYGAYVHGLKPAKHHKYWIERIQAVIQGQSDKKKLLILAPPGHAKSHWVSLTLPPWYLGNHPQSSILFLTSSGPMAIQFNSVVKVTLESPRHEVVFPDSLCRPDIRRNTRGWSSDGLFLRGALAHVKDPSYRAVGWGANVIGARPDGIIMDDVLSQEDAQSESAQKKAKLYYDMTIQSRLKPEGWIIAIMTCWHELDLGMYLRTLKDWEVVVMPALALENDVLGRKPGEALWPAMYPLEFLEEKRQEPPVGIGFAEFNAAYQQDPVGLGGDVFYASDFQALPSDFYDPDPQTGRSHADACHYYTAWDLAWSERDAADYTVGVTAALDNQNRLYVVDVVRGRWQQRQIEDQMVDQVRRHNPFLVGVEETSFHKAATQALLQNVRKRVMATIRSVPADRDKRVNASLAANRGQAGLLFADKSAPWWPAFHHEVMGFPNAANDDQVDALSFVTLLMAHQKDRRHLRDIRWNGERLPVQNVRQRHIASLLAKGRR